MSERYTPSAHDGLRKDGQPDQRVKGHESDAHKQNAEQNLNNNNSNNNSTHSSSSNNNSNSGSNDGQTYHPTEHDGLRKDGQPDQRVKGHESDAHKQNAEKNLNNQ
ncbi:hypothetical protein HKX48_008658 [Thoreauomyces humboldtii]|nr:hypothetical protein HKX48_008658 [Thoreauomyces humboldtii]